MEKYLKNQLELVSDWMETRVTNEDLYDWNFVIKMVNVAKSLTRDTNTLDFALKRTNLEFVVSEVIKIMAKHKIEIDLFGIKCKGCGQSKLRTVKLLKDYNNFNLKEAKNIVDTQEEFFITRNQTYPLIAKIKKDLDNIGVESVITNNISEFFEF